MGVSASGCHHNISLWRGGEDDHQPRTGNGSGRFAGYARGITCYLKGGENTFLPDDRRSSRCPAKRGLNVIGGVVRALATPLRPIGCSTVNSYRRLWDTGFWAPLFADWGYPEPDNRSCVYQLRVVSNIGAVDSMVNPYLMGSDVMRCCHGRRHPTTRQLDPGKPEERNIYEAIEAGQASQANCPCPWAMPLKVPGKRTTSSAPGMPGEMYRLYHGI